MSSDSQILAILHQAAQEVGLEVRATEAVEVLPSEVRTRVRQWMAEGRAGQMDYLSGVTPLLEDPRAWKDWAQSMVLVALPYAREAGGFRDGGRVARYALGRDYHNLIGKRLERLGKRMRAAGIVSRFRACTDAAPVLEREWALRGKVGWRGKNTLVLDPEFGPWVLLGELLVDVPLPRYRKTARRWATCGTCTRCLDVCPTGALDAAWSMDARLCLSYLTIELRESIPLELRPALSDWVFGCDLCLEVCPFGDHAGDHAAEWGEHPALAKFSLEDLLGLSEAQFEQDFLGSPLKRPGRAGLARNACVVLGNLGRGEGALRRAVQGDSSAMVRGHAAWALGKLGDLSGLRLALTLESDPEVCREIDIAIQSS
jgi:epoxyqueuosine reductase